MQRLITLALLLAADACAETVTFKIMNEGVLEQRLRLAHKSGAERYIRLKALFEQTGCSQFREQAVKGSKQPNLICSTTGSGASPHRILVGAHYDCAGGDGVVDNWTGAILLPSLEQFMREAPRRHTFEFIGFAAEEKGLLGSRAYLKSLAPAERKQIVAVITMDSLGLTPTKYWPNSSNNELADMAARVAYSLKLDFAGVNTDAIGTTDSATFHKAGIPVLSLHSVTQDTLPVINSRKDVWESVQWKDYYDTNKLVSALLTYLDQKLP